MGAALARRRIGQAQLAIVGSPPRGDTSFDEMSRLVDWTEIDRLLIGISAAEGETGMAAPGSVPGAAAGDVARPIGRAPGRSAG